MNPKHIIFAIVLVCTCLRHVESNCSSEVFNLPGYTCVKDMPIGQGAAGTAYLIKKDGITYVMKVQAVAERSKRELNILESIRDTTYVVDLVDHATKFGKYYFVITYGSQGSLLDFIEKSSYFSDMSNVYSFFRKLYEGMKGIHGKGFIHADLKLENVVVTAENEPMIIDFDMAVEIGKTYPPRGTLQYMPPEILKEFQQSNFLMYNEQMDLYSFTVMMYAVYYKRFPLGLTSINYILMMNLTITMDRDTPIALYDMVFGGLKPASSRILGATVESALLESSLMPSQKKTDAMTRYSLNDFASEDEKTIGLPKIEMYIYGFLIVLVLLIIGCCFGCYFCCCGAKKRRTQYFENGQHVYT